MKRTIILLAGAAAIAAGVYVVDHVRAQQGAPGAAALSTRVALVNLGQVFRNYQKFKNFEEQMKSSTLWYQKQIDDRKNHLTQMQADYQKQTDANARDQVEKQMKQLQREVQDMTDDAKTKLSKAEFDQLVQTYREVQDATSRYARVHNFELVLHYNDGIGADAFAPAIFSRKLANGACQPLYMAPGMDITGDVIAMLNANMQAPAAPGGR